jgi:chitin disaccharide deacetylase
MTIRCFLALVRNCLLIAGLASVHADEITAGKPTVLFLTFDDGPINATLDVLDILKVADVRATFFINAFHLDGLGGENEDKARIALRRILQEGHLLANHSYDHMDHNGELEETQAPEMTAYKDPAVDYLYFVPNSTVTETALGSTLKLFRNNQMRIMGRLPYSNVWRTSGARVTSTRASHSLSLMTLVDDLHSHGMAIYGWDIEWGPSNWDDARPSNTLPTAKELMTLIEARDAALSDVFPLTGEWHYELPRRVVILAHDFLFEDSFRGSGGQRNLPHLKAFIRLAQAKGYRFETLDRY